MRIFSCLLVVALVALAGPVRAPTIWTGSGTILVGNPSSTALGGLTENLTPCNGGSILNGADGTWFNISSVSLSPLPTATLTMSTLLDADAYFYNASCTFISAGTGLCNEATIGVTEVCTVPANSAFILVNAKLGTGSFTMTLTS